MATREENIKKINEELEKLDDDELEKISGGDLFGFADEIWKAFVRYRNARRRGNRRRNREQNQQKPFGGRSEGFFVAKKKIFC